MRELIYYIFWLFWTIGKKFTVKQEVSHWSTSLWIPLNKNSSGLIIQWEGLSLIWTGESRRSRLDYNCPGTLRLSDRYTNSRGRCDLMEHDNPATRAPVLQAIKELARTSRTSTELWDEYESVLAENTIRLGFWKLETDSLANSASPAEVARAKSNQQNPCVSNDGG
jgi:hypothetical protein